MELPARVVSAMNAMSSLGFSWDKTKPVLKNLLKIYEHNWDHIESESYRVLADAVLDSMESGDKGFKRMCCDGEVKQMNDVENGYCSRKRAKLGKGASDELPNNEHRKNASTAIINRPFGYRPHKLQSSISSTSRDKEISLRYEDRNAITNVDERAQNSSIKIELASSCSGEVRLVILCDPTLYPPNFQIPSIEVLCKMVEDKYLKPYKISEPNFSLFILLKEMCHCVIELSSKSSAEQGNNDMIQGMNLNFKVHSNNRIERGKGTDETRSSKADSLSLVVFQPQHSSRAARTVVVCEADICRGEENLRISLANTPAKRYPPSFHYISRNIVYQSAYVNISLARIGHEDCCSTCSGDCLAGNFPCQCARETGGDYAYTSEGLVKREFLDAIVSMKQNRLKKHLYFCKDCPIERIRNEIMPDPCKGHWIRKFVKECWSKCGCSRVCGNRLVQRGITRNLQVFWSAEGKGWGLRALDELPKGAFICEYVGEILTNAELFDRQLLVTGQRRHTYPVLLDADWGSEQVLKDEEALCLDATFYGNVARFINHRCGDANIVEVPVEIETPDHHYYHLAFFTVRKVEALEELTWDYGIDFDDQTHPIKAFSCCCGSKLCRDKRSQIRRSALVLG